MLNSRLTGAQAQDVAPGSPQRLNGVMKNLVDRIELLEEDNRQLRAAIHMYREIIRRSQTAH